MPIIRPLKPGTHPYGRMQVTCDTIPNLKAPDKPEAEIVTIEAAGRIVVVQLTPGGKKAKVTVDGVTITAEAAA